MLMNVKEINTIIKYIPLQQGLRLKVSTCTR